MDWKGQETEGKGRERKEREGKRKREKEKDPNLGLYPPKPKWHQNFKARLFKLLGYFNLKILHFFPGK